MPLSRTTLETQLAKAKSALATRVDQLTAAQVQATAYRRDPKWRELTAEAQQLGRRLNAVTVKEKLAVEVAARKLAGSEAGSSTEE